MVIVVVCILVLAVDQISKYIVFSFTTDTTVIPGLLKIVHAKNKGVAFGLFNRIEGGNIILIIISVVTIGVLFFLFIHYCRNKLWGGISLGLILGGAISNLVDRVGLGYVRDFIDIHVKNFKWPTFNLADVAICAGIAVLIIALIREEKKSHGSKEPNPENAVEKMKP